jgi:hypothetical protein
MKLNNLAKIVTFLSLLSCGQSLYCQPLYNGLFIGIFAFLASACLSTIIQAIAFHWSLKNVSFSSAAL